MAAGRRSDATRRVEGGSSNMDYSQLGNSGLLVFRLCLGTMTFGDGSGVYRNIGNVGQQEADIPVRASGRPSARSV